ncbi:MAG: AbrB/MazE/SpoVT family DNA-binding domain-containing protein [Oscillospiraceae bacterium]|nr:AbrB/MazE/SpoVT family DNA-binding domain-containing protein [Oscillospiraceae bacterium]
MKANKITMVKSLDKLGRLVIPKEYRDELNIAQQELLEILLEENSLRIRKVSESCALCGKKNKLIFLKNKAVCRDCLFELQKQL